MIADANMRVLIVDDYDAMLRIMRNLLRQLNFNNVEEARDGGSALQLLKAQNNWGLIISDWSMEPMSGIQLLREVRGTNSLAEIPFIMVTAESKPENITAATEAGVSGYIVKPFNADALKSKIIDVIGEL